MVTMFILMAQVWASEIADVEILVKGMVCSFCVQGIEKTFTSEESVEKVTVDLEQSTVSVWIKENKVFNDKTITDLIESSGYNVEQIKRNDER